METEPTTTYLPQLVGLLLSLPLIIIQSQESILEDQFLAQELPLIVINESNNPTSF